MTLDLAEPCRLYLGTGDGLRTATLRGGDLEQTASAVAGNAVRAIDVHPDDPTDAYVGCGLRGWGLYHTADAGATVEGLGFDDRWVWGLTRHPDDPGTVYVGTEPPMLYVSDDDGETFEALDGIEDLPSRPDWTFFHEPFHAGHVHGIAIHPGHPERVFAGVEHGALIASPDGGETWRESLVGCDVHRVAIHPTDPERLFAATGSGLYRSRDGGADWTQIPALRGSYLHAVVFHPDEPDRMYVYAAGDDSPVHRSDDAGDSWEPVGEGLPSARPADTLRLHPADPEVVLYAGDADEDTSHLFVSTDAGTSWERAGPAFPKVWRLEVTRFAG